MCPLEYVYILYVLYTYLVYIAYPCSGMVETISVVSYAALAAGLMVGGHITVLHEKQGAVSFQCSRSG